MIQNIRRKGKRCMEYLPEALSIMGIGVTVVFLTLSLLIIALWALGRLIPKHIVSAGEEKVSLDQEETTVLGKTLESSKNIRVAMIAVALAHSIQNNPTRTQSISAPKKQRVWWTQGLTAQFVGRTIPQETGANWKVGKDWINRNYNTEQIVGSLVFNERIKEPPSKKTNSTPNNKEAAAAAAVAIAQRIENPIAR
ncbi:MAG: hypothetical protein FI725_05830 [SAR202 cluster bacterium]|nr:hypothetical protein [SAR202 cluster bacterium]